WQRLLGSRQRLLSTLRSTGDTHWPIALRGNAAGARRPGAKTAPQNPIETPGRTHTLCCELLMSPPRWFRLRTPEVSPVKGPLRGELEPTEGNASWEPK